MVAAGAAGPGVDPELHQSGFLPRYAVPVVQRIVTAVERLATFPESGRVVPERRDREIREVIVKPYRVVYQRRLGRVEVVTVFRASRLFPGLG